MNKVQFVFVKSQTLLISSSSGLSESQEETDSIDFAAFHSHPTGEDWWSHIRRFQQPMAASLRNRSITLLQPMGFSAHFLPT